MIGKTVEQVNSMKVVKKDDAQKNCNTKT